MAQFDTKLDNSWLFNLLQAVNASVSPSTLFRRFAEDVSTDLGVKTVQVYKFLQSGDLHLEYYYGLQDDEVAKFVSISPAASLPITDCLRSKELYILSSKTEIAEVYPLAKDWVYIPEAIICFPLKVGSQVEGAMVFTFNSPLTEAPFNLSEQIPGLRVLGELCQLLTNYQNSVKQIEANSNNFFTIPRLFTEEKTELSKKHREILALIAKGCTNKEIAIQMNYSEASIRIELGKLFARMGVDNRQEAAAVAHKYSL
jgi:DNA-binding CsgD family transcriptional regulator